jgi:DNA-binding XRE family transcriptional regulator
MKGTEKAHLFKTGQYGRLYITSGSHARGRTLRIQVLPEGEKALPNGSGNECLNKNAVTVYDAISGQRGWTEVYGWLHEGKWQDDFRKLVVDAEKEIYRKILYMSDTPKLDEVCRKKCKKITAEQLIIVGRNIRRIRLKNKQSQQDIAFFVFSDKSSISALERGVAKNVNLLTLVKIAELFSITVEDLLKE